MQTSDPDIYAAGDCVECTSLVTGRKMLAPYGDLANLQGRVAGQNAVLENSAEFPGITRTSICKIFDFSAGFTGLNETAAREPGYTDVVSATCAGKEYEEMRLGIGEILIPPGALRRRLHELPQDKSKEIILYCKISLRGYEAATMPEANGWRNVKVMEGGIMAWPYPREK
jgi:NADPH-dependent 2,4-dienoyl-CoA reductase/sulfur reductase-like enzyme